MSCQKQRYINKIQRLEKEQNGKCFYCRKRLSAEHPDSNIDHVIAKARGGGFDDGNTVLCCVAINRYFGEMNAKEKIKHLLDGNYPCSLGKKKKK